MMFTENAHQLKQCLSRQIFQTVFPANFPRNLPFEIRIGVQMTLLCSSLKRTSNSEVQMSQRPIIFEKNQILLILHEIFSKTNRFPTSFAELLRGKKHGA